MIDWIRCDMWQLTPMNFLLVKDNFGSSLSFQRGHIPWPDLAPVFAHTCMATSSWLGLVRATVEPIHSATLSDLRPLIQIFPFLENFLGTMELVHMLVSCIHYAAIVECGIYLHVHVTCACHMSVLTCTAMATWPTAFTNLATLSSSRLTSLDPPFYSFHPLSSPSSLPSGPFLPI